MTSKTSGTTPASPAVSLNWVRLTGLLLLLAAAALNAGALAWLLTPEQELPAGFARAAALALQISLAVAGIALLTRPQLLAAAAALRPAIVGAAAVLLLVGVIASLGMQLAPAADYRFASEPLYTCGPTDAYCNEAAARGVQHGKRYGKGLAFADINGDGAVDIFAADADPRLEDDWGFSAVYLNDGSGQFQAVDAGLGEADLNANWTGSFADYDNDGDPDLLLVSGGYAGWGLISMYENRFSEGGRFAPITERAGFGEFAASKMRWWGIAWADYDNDGFLDVAVSRLYAPALLFHNNGDGTFTDVTEALGVKTTGAGQRDGKNIVWLDYDNDGDLDLYLAGIKSHNLFENLEGKYMLDITERVFAGLLPPAWAYDPGDPAVFAAAAADFNQDGWEDLYLGRQIEQDLVLFNQGDGSFLAAGTEVGIDTALVAKNSREGAFENTMGLGVGDLLDDGWPDVIIGSGDPVRAAEDVVFCNRGGTFERCTELLRGTADQEHRSRTHGIAFADINQDGRTDVLQNLGGHAPWDQKSGIDSREYSALFVSNALPATNTASVILEGSTSNRDAIGARLKLMAAATHYYTVRSSQAFQSQNERAILLALGDQDSGQLQIRWPSGTVSTATVRAGSRSVIREPAGQ